jgi:transcriptional regulator with XRE-family HTH domain
MTEPVSPLLRWLCEEQADIHGTELAELSGIARQTWSKVRQGKQDLTSDLLWRCMEVIARLRPRSECGQVVSIVKSQNDSENKKREREEHPLLRIERALSELKDETEENQAMLLMARRLRESKNNASLINWRG